MTSLSSIESKEIDKGRLNEQMEKYERIAKERDKLALQVSQRIEMTAVSY